MRRHCGEIARNKSTQNGSKQRLKLKLQQCLRTLSTINWTEKRKQKVAAVLTPELTSPVVSDEEDSNLLHSIGFTWESDQLINYKNLLHNYRTASASSIAEAKMKTLRPHSTRFVQSELPKDLPLWSLREDQEECVS